MSIALMTGAWRLDIPSGPKLVLLSLCDNANDQGECYPSVPVISERCSMAERTVQNHIQNLVELGFMRRFERTGRSTVYHLDPRRICTPANSAPPQDLHHTPAEVAPPPPQILHPTPADSAPRTVKEPSIEPLGKQRQARAAPAPPPPCPDDVTQQTWNDWLQLRKLKRATTSPTVINGARGEARKADMPFEEFLKVWVRRGSQTLEAEWLKPAERGHHPLNRSLSAADRRAETIAGLTGRTRGSHAHFDSTVDVVATVVEH